MFFTLGGKSFNFVGSVHTLYDSLRCRSSIGKFKLSVEFSQQTFSTNLYKKYKKYVWFFDFDA